MALKYNLGILGWYNFEGLVQTLLKIVIGPGVTSFGGTKDGGRDASFNGAAPFPSREEQWAGDWIFQVKYVDFEIQGVRTARTQLKQRARREFENVLARNTGGLEDRPGNYVLLTNVPLTAQSRMAIDRTMRDTGYGGNFVCIDGVEVCQLLDIHPQVRRSYPQLIGLVDLDRIINKELYSRSTAFVRDWQPRLSTFVGTEAYMRAFRVLRAQKFVVLDGPPEAGKTTIAAALSLQLAADGFETIYIRGPEDFYAAHDPGREQVFVADDAVGTISLNASLADNWSRDLVGILHGLDPRHYLIWTTRSYILDEALSESRLGEETGKFPGPHEVLIEVGDMTTMEKAEILYNHAKQADLRKREKQRVRTHASEIVSHDNFTPEKVRQLFEIALPDWREGGAGGFTWAAIEDFLNDPGTHWKKAYGKIGQAERRFLLSLLDFPWGAQVAELEQAYERRLEALSGKRLAFGDCLARLRHSFVRVTRLYGDKELVEFQHPSLRDLMIGELMEDAHARRQYVALSSASSLAQLIQGLSLRGGTVAGEHVIRLSTTDELDLLMERLEEVCAGTLPVEDWDGLISACEVLVPRDEDGDLFAPHEDKLANFARSGAGLIFSKVLDRFASDETFKANRRYTTSEWLRLLSKYYRIASYSQPIYHIQYLNNVWQSAKKHGLRIALPFASLVKTNEPLLARQLIDPDLVYEWDDEIKAALDELVSTGETIEEWDRSYDYRSYDDQPPDYDDWWSDSTEMAAVARSFYSWAPYGAPGTLHTLSRLLQHVSPPDRDDDLDDDWNRDDADGRAYWDIHRLFEDL